MTNEQRPAGARQPGVAVQVICTIGPMPALDAHWRGDGLADTDQIETVIGDLVIEIGFVLEGIGVEVTVGQSVSLIDRIVGDSRLR